MSQKISILGAGGHAKVVIATLQALGQAALEVYDDDSEKWGTDLLGVPVLGPIAEASRGDRRAVAALGDNRMRERLVAALDLDWTSAIHPTAVVHSSISIGPGSVVLAGAIIQPGTRVGRHVIVNTAACVDHDCDLVDFAHIAPGALLAGAVRVGEGTLIGIGASVVQEARIGDWATVGAGAAVTGNLPGGCTAVGVPARVLGEARR